MAIFAHFVATYIVYLQPLEFCNLCPLKNASASRSQNPTFATYLQPIISVLESICITFDCFLGGSFSGALEDIPTLHCLLLLSSLSPILPAIAALDSATLSIPPPLPSHAAAAVCRRRRTLPCWEAETVQREVMDATTISWGKQEGCTAMRGDTTSSRRIKRQWRVKRQGHDESSRDNQPENHEANWRHNKRWQHINKMVRGSVGVDIGNTTTSWHIKRRRCIKRWWHEKRPPKNQPGQTRGNFELEAMVTAQ